MIRIYQIKNLEETVMEIVILKRKILIERIKNNLDEFEMKELELEAEAEIDALKNFEKPIRKRIQEVKLSKFRNRRARNKENSKNIN